MYISIFVQIKLRYRYERGVEPEQRSAAGARDERPGKYESGRAESFEEDIDRDRGSRDRRDIRQMPVVRKKSAERRPEPIPEHPPPRYTHIF